MKKSFGQHLLVDKHSLNQIIDSIDIKSTDIILEIGAGSGFLTCLLAEKARKVYAVEIERDIVKQLKIKVSKFSNIEIIEKNFLKLNLANLVKKPFRIVGNIPYNITSKILLNIFGDYDSPGKH